MIRKILLMLVGVGIIVNSNCLVFADNNDGYLSGEETTNSKLPEIYIRAVNPGYTIDGKSNVGEMIELARRDNSDTPISLAGATVGYTNSSGNYSILIEFPENSWMTGENLLLRLASSPGSELASMTYTKTLAFKAGIDLRFNNETIDELCWTGKDGCYRDFRSASPTTLVRNMVTLEFEHLVDYSPNYNEDSFFVESRNDEEGYGAFDHQCVGLVFSEILSYYETLKSEQFIEFYNTRSEQILMDGCQIKYKSKTYILSGIIGPEEYYVYYPKEFNLTKNPVNSNKLELIDIDGTAVDELNYPNGQRKGTSYAFIGYNDTGEEIWKVTYAPTPGMPNNYQEFKTCETGKVINKETGNCVKVASVKEKVCPDGQYLNLLTGRCKKYKTATEKTCKEGYYLNTETGRCRKIKDNDGANYSLEPGNYEEQSSFIALYAILAVVGLGLGYLVYEFRYEILKLWRRVFR